MNNKNIDFSLLENYLERLGKNVVSQMIALYQEESTKYYLELAKLIGQENQNYWETTCHKMKGAAGSVGFTQVFSFIVSIEKLRDSAEKKSQLLRELEDQNQKSIKATQLWINKE